MTTAHATSVASHRSGVLDRLSPRWARTAASWLEAQRDPDIKVIGLITAILLLLLGLILLLGGGYTSIQGVRLPLATAGLPIQADDFPAPQWWLLPLACTFVEVLVRIIPGLRVVWWPALIYDGTTTAIYVALGLNRLMLAYGYGFHLILLAGISAVLGLFVAIAAEQLTVTALILIRAARRT